MDLTRPLVDQQAHFDRRAVDSAAWMATYTESHLAEIDADMRAGIFLNADVLELACGVGFWTERIVRLHPRTVHAIDGSLRMIGELAAKRLPRVYPEQQDLFAWKPTHDYDVVFAAHWLSHIPPHLLPDHWVCIAAAVRPGGTVVLLDSTPAERRYAESGPTWDAPYGDTTISLARRPPDRDTGDTATAVRQYYEPDAFLRMLDRWGWSGRSHVIGQAQGRGLAYYTLERAL